MISHRQRCNRLRATAIVVAGILIGCVRMANASTYVVPVPLDSPIYDELSTLNGLGWLDTYIDEIKPISRIEDARLTLEAQANLQYSERDDPLASAMLSALRDELGEEIGWLEHNAEDDQPTMVQPVERLEAQYIFTSGPLRYWRTGPNGVNATEVTPLMQNADGVPTGPGSNEIMRLSGWGGFGGFLTLYGEGAMAGPLTRQIHGQERFMPLDAESVVSLGNVAISFGMREMRWGTGFFAPLSHGANAQPFPALSVYNIHPTYLPWIFRYLGPSRRVLFMGQLDAARGFAHPWIVGHILSFKPLPWFEFGLDRVIEFGGRGNDHYNFGGFLGRFTGLATGSPINGNTKSRGGAYLKFTLPQLRGLQVYQEILGTDNLTKEIPGIGRYIPFLAVSYQGGFYLPRLTADGKTDLRFEYALIEPNYSVHPPDSLYYSYQNQFMGNPLGPNATQVDIQVGRWLRDEYKLSLDAFYTEQAPGYGTGYSYPAAFYPYSLTKEHSFGAALDVLKLPSRWPSHGTTLAGFRARIAVEYGDHFNYNPSEHSLRLLFVLSTSLSPHIGPWKWN